MADNNMLNTKIGIDFSEAISQIENFSNRLQRLSSDFARLSGAADKTLGKSIAQIVMKKVEEIGDINVNLKNIDETVRSKIERAVADYIIGSGLKINTAGKPLAINLDLDKSTIDRLSRTLSDQVADSIDFGSLKRLKVSITKENMADINARLERKFNQSLKRGITVDFGGGEEGRVQLNIGKAHMDAIVEKIRQRILSFLRSERSYVFGELEPIKINPEDMKAAFDRIRDMVTNIEKHLNINPEVLGDLPNLDEALTKFKQNLRTTLSELNKVAEIISSIDIGSATPEAIKSLHDKVKVLRDSILSIVDKYVLEATHQLDSFKGGEIDLGKFMAVNERVSEKVEKLLLQQLYEIERQIVAAMGVTIEKDKNNKFAVNVKKLQSALVELAAKAVEDISGGEIRIDTMPVINMLRNWAEVVGPLLQKTVTDAITPMTQELILANNKLVNDYVNAIKSLTQLEYDFSFAEGQKLTIPADELQAKVIPAVEKAITEMVNNLVPAFGSDLKGKGLSKEVVSRTKNIITSLLIEQVENMANIISSSGITLTKRESSVFDKRLSEESKKLLDVILERTRKAIEVYTAGIANNDFSAFSAKEQAAIKSAIEGTYNKVIKQFTDYLSAALRAFLTTADINSQLESQIRTAVEAGIRNASIGEVSIKLNDAVSSAISKVEEAVKHAVLVWEPADIGVNTTIVTAIKKSIRQMTSAISNSMAEEVSNLVADSGKADIQKFTRQMNRLVNNFFKKYVESASSALSGVGDFNQFFIKTNELHSAVRQNIARSMNMTVQQLVSNFPTLHGDEDFRMVMKSTMQVIFEQFQKEFGRNMKDVINSYREEISKVHVTPDTSPIQELMVQMINFQQEIVRKVKQMIEEQFRVLIRELRGMRIIPASLGATPVQNLTGGGGTSTQTTTVTPRKSVSAAIAEASAVNGIPVIDNYNPGYVGYIRATGGRTHTLMNSILNTLRYIIAGKLVGMPMFRTASEALSATADMDYEYEKARQNLLAKYRGVGQEGKKPFETYAEEQIRYRYENRHLLGELGIPEEIYLDEAKRAELIEKLRLQTIELIDKGIIETIQNIAINYGIYQKDMATVWQIATRSQSDPIHAFAMASAAARIYATEREEIDPVSAAKGLEAIVGQWQLNPAQQLETGERIIEKYANMIIKASLLSQGSSKDFLDAMSGSGALFNAFSSSDMDDVRKFATALAYQSIFIQATGKSGSEAATFFRNIIASPYTNDTVRYLEKLAASPDPIIQKVSPYYTTYDEEGRRITRQKDFHQQFIDVVNAALRLRELGNAAEANRLLTTVFKTRTYGYEQGMELTIEKMFKRLDELGVKRFEEYIDRIASVQQSEIDEYIGGLSNTFTFRKEQVRSNFQAASYSVLEQLKPEFAKTLNALNGMLRSVRENADTIAHVLELASTMLLAIGVKKLGSVGVEKAKNIMFTEEMKYQVEPLLRDRAGLIRYRHELSEKYRSYREKLDQVVNQRGDIDVDSYERAKAKYSDLESKLKTAQEELAELEKPDLSAIDRKVRHILRYQSILNNPNLIDPEKRARVESNINKLTEELNILINTPNPANIDAIQAKRLHIENLKQGLQAEEEKIRNFERKIGDIDSSGQFALKEMNRLHKEITDTDRSISNITKQTERLKKAMAALGADEKTLEAALVEYDRLIRVEATNKNHVASSTKYFTETLEKLNREFDEGYINAKQYIKGLQQIREDKVIGSDAILAGVSLGGLKNLGIKALGMLKGLGTTALIAAAVDVVGNVLSSSMMSEADRKSTQLEELKKTVDIWTGVGRRFNEGKILAGFGQTAAGVWNWLVNGLTNWFTGGGVSFSDSAKAYWYSALGYSRTEILERLNYAQRKREADIALGEMQRAENELIYKDWVDIDGDGIKDVPSAIGSYETIQDFLQRNAQREQISLNMAAAEYAINRYKMIEAGLREDSETMTNLLKEFYQNNIDALEKSLENIKAYQQMLEDTLGDMAMYDQAWQTLEEQRLQKEQAIAEQRERLMEAEAAAISRLENQFSLAMSQLQVVSSGKLASMYAAGYRKDSIDYINKQIEFLWRERNKLLEENRQWEELLDNPALKAEERDKLRQKIAQNEININQLLDTITTLEGSKLQGLLNEMQRMAALNKAEFSIMKSRLEMHGYSDESTAMRALQRRELISENLLIAQEIEKLNKLMENGLQNEAQREDILIQIRNLEAIQAQNIAEMYKLQKQAHWGLPAGIQPMTIYEYEARKNTERSLVVQQGNMYITVRFDNVYTHSKDQVEENVVKPLREMLADFNREMTTGLNRQAASYISNRRY